MQQEAKSAPLHRQPLVSPDEEVRGGCTVSRDMKALWAVQLDMLQALIDVCRRHGLRLWAEGGTMLGAVRHHGYIPWDDDIDMAMPRPDYDRLMALGGEFAPPLFLQSVYIDPYYIRSHAQLRCDGTACIRPSESYRRFHQGIFIDIFPLDGCPDDPAVLHALARRTRKDGRRLKAAELHVFWSGRWLQVFRKARMRLLLAAMGRSRYFARAEERLRAYPCDRCERWAEITFYGDRYLFPRRIFDDTVWMPFEGIKVPVPAGYDEFLSTLYGPDYMTPVRDPSCHGTLVVSTTEDWHTVAPRVYARYKRQALARLLGKLGVKME